MITDTTQGLQTLAMFGTTVSNANRPSANKTILARNAVIASMRQTMILDVKQFLSSRFTGGKSWADVDHVIIYIRADNAPTGTMYINNFR